MADKEPKLIYVPVIDENTIQRDAIVIAQAITLRKADTNGNGHLSRKEATQSLPVTMMVSDYLFQQTMSRAVLVTSDPITLTQEPEAPAKDTYSIPSAFVMNNRTLFDARAMDQAALNTLGVTVAPKGVDRIKLSDFCGADSVLPCQNLPNGKILVSLRTPSKT